MVVRDAMSTFRCSTTSETSSPNHLTKLYEMYVKGES